MHIKQTRISTAQLNLLKEHVSPTLELTDRIMHENTTRYIKHLAENANFKGGTFNRHCNGLIGNRFEMPNVSYTHPLCVIIRAAFEKNKRELFLYLFDGKTKNICIFVNNKKYTYGTKYRKIYQSVYRLWF